MSEVHKSIQSSESEHIGSEGYEKQPHITLEFFFGFHMTEGDAKILGEKIKNCDVFIPEAGGWWPGTEGFLQSVSDGTLSQSNFKRVLDAQFAEGKYFEAEQLKVLYSSKKKILLVDIPEEHDAHKMRGALIQERKDAFSAFLGGNYTEYVAHLKKSFEIEALAESMREKYIQEHISQLLPSLSNRYDELKNKSEIKVFAFFGATHTNVYRSVKSENSETEVTWSIPDMVYPLQAEILRRHMRGGSVDEVLYARYFVGQILTNYTIREVSEDSVEVAAVIRFITSKLTLEDIKEISKRMGSAKENDTKIKVLFSEVSRRTSLPLPTNKKGFETLLELSMKIRGKGPK